MVDLSLQLVFPSLFHGSLSHHYYGQCESFEVNVTVPIKMIEPRL